MAVVGKTYIQTGTFLMLAQWKGKDNGGECNLTSVLSWKTVYLLPYLSFCLTFFVFSMLLIKKNAFYLVNGNSFVCTGFLRENHHLEVAARRK